MPYKKKWKEIIPNTKEILNITIPKLLDDYLNFENKNLIFFDLETLGFNPKFEYEQILEIAAKVVDGKNLNSSASYWYKVNLLGSAEDLLNNPESIERYNWERRQRRRGKIAMTSPTQILEFTNYYKNNTDYISEESALKNFFKFIEKIKNPVLVAHNTEFDINYLIMRGKLYGLKLPQTDVIDTLKISRFFFLPMLKTISANQESPILNKLVRYHKKTIHHSSRLGDLANALEIDSTNWHSAYADVNMTLKLYEKMLSIFTQNKNINIEVQKKIALTGVP